MTTNRWHKTKRRKCRAWSKVALYCDGCGQYGGKCPIRDKYRDLRHTKFGKAKYGPFEEE